MTEQELEASVKALNPEFRRLHERVDVLHQETDAAHARGDLERIQVIRVELDAVKHDLESVGTTLDTLKEILEGFKSTVPVNHAIVYAEAVESRVTVGRMGNIAPEEWRTEMIAMLDAKSFYWSPMMVSVVQASASALPSTTLVEPDLFPVLAGWWWFGRDNGRLVVKGASPRRVAAIGWLRQEDRVWVGAFSADWPELGRRELHTVWNCSLELGRTLNDISISAQRVDAIKELDYDDLLLLLRFLVGGLLFVRQRVLVATATVIGRGARKRVMKVTTEHGLQVIHLRKAETLRGHVEHGEHKEFSCQWWVRGHWRQQPYKDGIRPKWIDPFIKGDPDKPMKTPTEKVFAVVR